MPILGSRICISRRVRELGHVSGGLLWARAPISAARGGVVFWDADARLDTRTGILGCGIAFWDVGAYLKLLLLVGGNTVWRFLVQILPAFVIFLLKPHFCLDLQYRTDSDTMQ